MMSKSILVALLTLSLHAFLSQAAPYGASSYSEQGEDRLSGGSTTNLSSSDDGGDEQCDVPHTVTVTVQPTPSISSPAVISSSASSVSSQSAGTSSKGSSNGSPAGEASSSTTNGEGSSDDGNSSSRVSSSSGSSSSSGTSSQTSGNNGSDTSTSSSVSTGTSSNASSSSTNTGNTSSSTTSSDTALQSSLTLDSSLIQTGFEQNGQATQEAGQVPSLTSSNNFINFCATVNVPLTNGQQVKNGSCNAAPMGVIAGVNNMPSSKFQFPKNFDTIKANTNFTVQMAIINLETGNFVNAQSSYFAAPQQVNAQGNIKGHSHFVIQEIDSLTSTTVQDPTKFAFFQGVNSAAVNGVLSATVTNGLPVGMYRLSSINAAANHQPVLVAVAQHSSLDDMVYFSVTESGQPASN